MNDNIIKFPKGDGTPQAILEQVLENVDEIVTVVIIVSSDNKNTGLKTTRATWSDQTNVDLSFVSRILDWEINQSLSSNHE